MLGAIRLAGKRSGAAEVKILVVRVSMGPQAARPVEFEEIPLRRSDRCGNARRQRNAVQLADHRVLGQPQPTADLGGRQPLLEKLSQPLDAVGRPGNDIHVCSPCIQWTPQSTLQDTYYLCVELPSSI